MNMIKIILLLIGMIIVVGAFVGIICLQVHISKNDKRGKFAIPIIMFALPFITAALFFVPGVVVMENNKSSSTVTETYVVEQEDEISDEEGNFALAAGAILILMYPAMILGFPCAIITLIIEMVYRSKRKRITDEEVIDIQNL